MSVFRISGHRLLLVAGKGGVGKTTVAASLALALARKNRRVLLAQMNAPPSLGSLLDSPDPDIRERPCKTCPGLWTVNLDPSSCVADFGSLRMQKGALTANLLKKAFSEKFIKAVPGVETLALMGRLWFYTQELAADGSFRFDNVVGETTGLGHLERLLGQPASLLSVLPRSVLKTDLQKIVSMLKDPGSTGIVLVALPESIAIKETLELYDRLRKMNHRVALVVANSIIKSKLWKMPPIENLLSRKRLQPPPIIREARFLYKRHVIQQARLKELKQSVTTEIAELPFLSTTRLSLAEITFLSSHMDDL